MAKYYKLIDAEDRSLIFKLPRSGDGGEAVYDASIRLVPGKKYVEYIDDPVFMRALLDQNYTITYTDARKRALDACGARYEVIRTGCSSCGRKKLLYWLVEVVE